MKRRLKRSFLTATMISATLVIVILMGIVNLLTAIERNNSDMEILNYLAANGGTFPIEEMDILDVFSGEMPLNIDPHDPDAMDIHPDSSGGSSEESAEEAQKGSAEGAPEGSAEEAPEGSNDAEHDADNNVNSEKTDNRFNDLNNDNTDAVKFRD